MLVTPYQTDPYASSAIPGRLGLYHDRDVVSHRLDGILVLIGKRLVQPVGHVLNMAQVDIRQAARVRLIHEPVKAGQSDLIRAREHRCDVKHDVRLARLDRSTTPARRNAGQAPGRVSLARDARLGLSWSCSRLGQSRPVTTLLVRSELSRRRKLAGQSSLICRQSLPSHTTPASSRRICSRCASRTRDGYSRMRSLSMSQCARMPRCTLAMRRATYSDQASA